MKHSFQWIIIAVSIYMIISLSRSVFDLWQRRTILEQEQERLTALEKKHAELKAQFETVQTPAFIEQEARNRLGLVKEGEIVVVIDPSVSGGVQAGEHSNEGSLDTLPNWKRWWRVFF